MIRHRPARYPQVGAVTDVETAAGWARGYSTASGNSALERRREETDGAEILWDLRSTQENFDDDRLVVVRNGQANFCEIVREHLTRVDYRDSFISQLRIPRAAGAGFTIDPRINFGQPTLSEFGVRVDDVLGRITAGETIDEVAADFDLPREAVSNLALAAA